MKNLYTNWQKKYQITLTKEDLEKILDGKIISNSDYMKLEVCLEKDFDEIIVGEKYISRNNDIVEIIEKKDDVLFPFVGNFNNGHKRHYTKYGNCSHITTEFDLFKHTEKESCL